MNSLIDHTLLKPDATPHMIKRLCREAIDHKFYAVCINPTWVGLAKECLGTSPVKVACVVGFPLGSNLPFIKALEAERAVEDGADEIDLVINIGKLKAGEDAYVQKEIRDVVKAAGVPVKVIIECALLTDEEKIKACELAENSGASMVKTSTGFGPTGATIEDIKLIKKALGGRLGIKASGGIKEASFAKALIEAGATRLGTSAGVMLSI